MKVSIGGAGFSWYEIESDHQYAMEADKITLTKNEFKKLVASGFITGYKYGTMHMFHEGYSKEQMRELSTPAEEELWIRVKKADAYEERMGLR